MTFDEACAAIRSFWTGAFPLGCDAAQQVTRLEREYGRALPPSAALYVAAYAPPSRVSFETVGNPIDLYTASEMPKTAEGYNWNPVTRQPIADWSSGWFLIGDEGADPIILDLDAKTPECAVLQAPHGEGVWDFDQVAPSIPNFLVLAAAQHHALTAFGSPGDAIIDDEQGFNLSPRAAAWYFPFVRRTAPDVCERWLGVFDNA